MNVNSLIKRAQKEERCEHYMEKFLSLDKGERVPGAVARHLLFCKKCHTSVRLLKVAERQMVAPLTFKVPLNDAVIQSVIQSVAPLKYKHKVTRPFSMVWWAVSGLLMVALCLAPSIITGSVHVRGMALSYGMVISFCITGYCMAFAIGNIDFFVKRMCSKLLR